MKVATLSGLSVLPQNRVLPGGATSCATGETGAERDIPVKIVTMPMNDVDRAIADDEETGFVKLHVKEGRTGFWA